MVGAGLMAGSANVIMQLGRPQVGYGVLESRVESGNLFRHPLKRARTTGTYLAVATFGTDEERRAYRRAVNGSHVHVKSTADSPVRYNAFDPELQLWVAACLYKGLEDVHAALFGGPAPEELYAEAVVLGTTLQVRPEMWPHDREAFARYWAEGLERVTIDDRTRAYLRDIAELRFLPQPFPLVFGRFHRFVTTGFLPACFRAHMKLSWTEHDQRKFDQFMRVVGHVVRRLPRGVQRFPYNAYLRDLRKRRRAGRPLV
ncbi:oxygenase MpaB family protein [Amycolatopsis rhabdoformis]|uniref:Oxygenase MpaB family protein n=1 Tax=Amycolatopsis rhabdoformis TaxID=1448059 RepID=A0ABZ1IM76_9PSEU|nr:oxygenase MpaB family protein [Amycolatopsis rhabdoformis]WSE35270.1 oxygenase MpaB family protein [Amycolatopsis rhabdoformis]